MKINQNNLRIFWSFIAERHLIYKKKCIQKLPRPWTEDMILSEFKFTNVFRDLDPGTKYVIQNIIPKTSNLENLIFNTIIYRLYNKIETFDKIRIQDCRRFDKELFESRLRELQNDGKKVFTNAFIVSGYSFLSSEGDKISRTVKIIDDISKVIPSISEAIEKNKDSKFTFEELLKLPGIGNFLTYQICLDIGYERKDIFDEDIFVIAGPGCKRGLDRIFESRGKHTYEGLITWLEDNQKAGFETLSIDMNELFSDRIHKRLNLMAIENCLCEFSKYMKAKNVEGRPRNRYR